jgi:hypothetical protein
MISGEPLYEEVNMSSDLGPMEIDCNAPPYHVVRSCQRLGFESPLDVRWCKVNHKAGQAGVFAKLTGAGRPTCSCGEARPELETYTFTFLSGRQVSYYLAQCPRCHAIFWDKT